MDSGWPDAVGSFPTPLEIKMIELRPFDELGGAHHGWLNTKHHFSFAGTIAGDVQVMVDVA